MVMIGGIGAIPRLVWLLPHNKFRSLNSNSNTTNRTIFQETNRKIPTNFSIQKQTHVFFTKAAAFSGTDHLFYLCGCDHGYIVGSTEHAEEPTTNVKFHTSLSFPSYSTSLSLIGTGFREKVFAIIGVKVYAAGLYLNPSIFDKLEAWKGRTAAEIQEDSSLFDLIYQAPLEKSLQIVLVRDVDGKIFWVALDEAISPRIKSPTVQNQA